MSSFDSLLERLRHTYETVLRIEAAAREHSGDRLVLANLESVKRMASQLRAVITLNAEERSDGSVYVHSPDVPLFHAVAPSIDGWVDSVEPALKRHLAANRLYR